MIGGDTIFVVIARNATEQAEVPGGGAGSLGRQGHWRLGPRHTFWALPQLSRISGWFQSRQILRPAQNEAGRAVHWGLATREWLGSTPPLGICPGAELDSTLSPSL